MRFFTSLMALCLTLSLSAQEVIMTGVLDGTLSGGNPRVVELYVNGTVNLSDYRIERFSNGNASSGTPTASFSGTFTNEFVYIVKSESAFTSVFGNSGDFANVIEDGIIDGNGDDTYVLVKISTGEEIDVTGGPQNSTADVYLDSWMYRNDNTGPDGAWVAANWSNVGANNSLDNPNNNATQIAALVPFGTYSVTPPGPAVQVAGNGNAAEPATDGGFTITLSEMAPGPVTVTYTLAGTATEDTDYEDDDQGSVTIPAGDLTAPVTISVLDDTEAEGAETIILSLVSVSDATYTASGEATIQLIDNEDAPLTRIHEVQGSGFSSPFSGQTVTVEGIVVADFQNTATSGLGGFYLQEEDADADADPLTSEGVFVFDNNFTVDVNVGDRVLVTGVAGEFSNLTQINVTSGGSTVTVVASNQPLPTPASLDLPITTDADLESIEGMLTDVVDETYITETFSIGRFGEFTVSEGERLIQFTDCNVPDQSQIDAYNDAQSRRRLTIDDGRGGDNRYPIVLGNGQSVTATNTLRSGSRVTGLTGVIEQRFVSGYRMQATDFTVVDDNPRPTAAPATGGNITVVGANVLNYFTTLGSRGADNTTEFIRQEAKIVNAICELDADVIGLVEIENNGYGASGALQTLIDAIEDECGLVYDFVVAPNTGSDQIQVALIYKPSTVEQSGTAASLTTPSSVFSRNRVPVAQTFRVVEAGNPDFGQEFTVCVNHWKSKGGGCDESNNGGAGNCNTARIEAAVAIRDWLATQPTGTTDTDILVIGDLNAYSLEVPITTFTDNGYVNTVVDQADPASFPCGGNPSYVFRGEWGSLDHALASTSLASQVTGAIPWAVNASEPTALDYDTQFNDPALYANDFYRFSDHNPVVVGLDLEGALPVTLRSFTGELAGDDVLLRWSTASETDSDRFEVQRQDVDGNFVTIGTLAAAGNSTDTRLYSFVDEQPTGGDNVYRLRMVDLDGSFTFSNLVTVKVESTNAVEVIIVGNRTFGVRGADAGARFALTDALGRTLQTGVVSNDLTNISANGVPAGVYFLTVRQPGNRSATFKVVVR